MANRILVLLTLVLLVLTAQPGTAQERNYWIQLEVHRSEAKARESAGQLSKSVAGVQGIETREGSFVLAIGRYDFEEARQIRVQLSNAGLIPVTSRVNGDISVKRIFWQQDNSQNLDPLGASRTGLLPTGPAVEFEGSEKLAIQTALKWLKDYDGAVDGLFGPATRRAVASFQERSGYEPTGNLSRQQTAQLLDIYNSETAAVGLLPVEDAQTGIGISIPYALVQFAGYDAPFVKYEPVSDHGMELYLISMEGNETSLQALHDVLRNSSLLPGQKSGSLRASSFTLEGNGEIRSGRAYATLNGIRLKGFVASWNSEHDDLMLRIFNNMQDSFRESREGTLNPRLAELQAGIAPELLAELPRSTPERTASGFFATGSGLVVTTASAVDGCNSVIVEGSEPMDPVIVDHDLGMSILRPLNSLSPIARARFGRSRHERGSPVSISGFAYGGELGYPTITNGAWLGADVVTRNPEFTMIDATILPGDFGGPVLDSSGYVIGMLRTPVDAGRELAGNINHLVSAEAIIRRAGAELHEQAASVAMTQIHPVDLSRYARDITVLVECYMIN